MFDNLINIVSDVAKVVVAPVEISLDLTSTITKPIAELAEDLVQEIKEATGNDK